jgi:primosomal protein N' (replication factor Y)
MFASVIVDIKNKEVNRQFDYIIKSTDEKKISKGMRVVVPFGEQIRMGYIVSVFEKSEQANKEIIEVLDEIPTISNETFQLIDYIYEQTHALYASIFETVVPSQIQLKYFREIKLVQPDLVDESFKSLFNKNNIFKIMKANHNYDYLIKKYQKLKAIEVYQTYEQKTKDKFMFVYRYNMNHQYGSIKRYEDLISQLGDDNYKKEELIDLGFSPSNIKTLLKHEVLMQSKVKVNRKVQHIFKFEDKKVKLTAAQQDVYQHISNSYHKHQDFLLKGVTGSGKTEIYMQIIEDMMKAQKQVLVLVPEITLIAPMAKRLKSRFQDVAIYHSALSQGERLDAYTQTKQGEISIVLGTRSAVFLPFDHLGAIIIDESHDDSYIQSEHVIYDAIDIAKLRATYHHIPMILGTATPKVSRYYEALNKSYELLELNERPFHIKQPDIKLIDMKKELKEGNTSIFSKELKQAINQRLNKKEQVMILFNRKGYAPFVMCRSCGHVPTCPTCGIALTYYKDEKTLKCHYCGHHEDYDHKCQVCGSHQIKEVGVGILYVEAMLKKSFPKAKILRMDANMTRTKGSHEILWNQFSEEKADILLGTQMIAKGLDFPKVTLVGVLMADLLLNIPSYQASEQTYNLLTQVAGRSGRLLPGEVIIQAYDLNHYALEATKKPYETFYKEAIYNRRLSNYEPFSKVSQFLFEGTHYLKTYQEAFKLKKALEKLDKNIDVLGPIPAYIKKRNERYRFIMTIKYSVLNNKVFEIMDNIQQNDIWIKFYPNQEIL